MKNAINKNSNTIDKGKSKYGFIYAKNDKNGNRIIIKRTFDTEKEVNMFKNIIKKHKDYER